MIKFKGPLTAAGAALCLSFIIGLISGVRFSSIIVRSFVTALVCGGFTFGVRILLEKFTPELFQALPEKEMAGDEGKMVNISIDDPIYMENAPPVKEYAADEKVEEDINVLASAEEELFEDAEDVESLDDVAKTQASEAAEQNMEKTANTKETSAAEVKEKTEKQELEELPDLEEFAPANEVLIDDTAGEDFVKKGTGELGISSNLGDSAGEADMKTMVQAVQTVLKRGS